MPEITIITKEMVQRGHMQSMRRAWSKNSKPVVWNNTDFDSATALARHLRMEPNALRYRITKKLPTQGHVAVYKKIGVNS